MTEILHLNCYNLASKQTGFKVHRIKNYKIKWKELF
jgi:hypothetical protein